MGRERALGATPLTDVTAVESAIALTGQARLALGAEGPPALDGIADRDDRELIEGDLATLP